MLKIRRRDKGKPPSLLGLRTIHEPTDSLPLFDIVAVHGLGAHPEYTWTSKASQSSGGVSRDNLLRDRLAPQFPEARILAFGYNSDFWMNAPVTTAERIGKELLDNLMEDRQKNANHVPIVFIGHSFGGIIIKQALRQSDSASGLLDSTCGIIFLGTPHLGSPMGYIGAAAASVMGFLGSNTGLLLSLRSNLPELTDLDTRFVLQLQEKMSRCGETKIVAFVEKMPTYILGWLFVGLIVDADSARGGHSAKTRYIDTDHSGLNKCKCEALCKTLIEELRNLSPGKTAVLTLSDQQKSFVRGELPIATGAEFDSHANEYAEECLQGTRSKILDDIGIWSKTNTPEHVYWLQGKAGTGKSTIALTVAGKLSARNRLAASFFFKRGESKRSSATLIFTTIAAQLARRLPKAANAMMTAVGNEVIKDKSLGEQFKKLIQQPAIAAQKISPSIMTVVIDAIDECEDKEDVKKIITLLSQKDDHETAPLKFFITSRDEPKIREGFNANSKSFVQCALHEVDESVIKHDIKLFLEARLIKIKGKLPSPWPNKAKFDQLLEMSTPLFIFASTVCRFIENDGYADGPEIQLETILGDKTHGNFNNLYLPILRQMVLKHSNDTGNTLKQAAMSDFAKIVGSIVTLFDPLPAATLAKLLDLTEHKVTARLNPLHSVLDVPGDKPIRIFHESFREFLIYPGTQNEHEFRINTVGTHKMLAELCRKLLSKKDGFKEDIRKLWEPRSTHRELENHEVDKCLPPEVQYAALYWVRHLESSGVKLSDGDDVFRFLQTHFLHWLATLSLVGKAAEAIHLIGRLQTLVDPAKCTKASMFLHDAKCFILNCRPVLDKAPLQLYTSVLIFTPERSIIRSLFEDSIGKARVKYIKGLEGDWSPCLQTLEGHSSVVKSVAFSADGRQLVSGSLDETVKMWDATTGTLQSTLQASNPVRSVALSADGKWVAAASVDLRVKVWDTVTGALHTLTGHSEELSSVAFSLDSKRLASASLDGTIKIWDTQDWTLERTIDNNNPDYVTSVVFSANRQWMAYLAKVSGKGIIMVWEIKNWTLKCKFKACHHSPICIAKSITFSVDSKRLAAALSDGSIQIWDIEKEALQTVLRRHGVLVSSAAFSADGNWMASGSLDKTIKIWDTTTWIVKSTFKDHSCINAVAFSDNSEPLVSASYETIKIWDTTVDTTRSTVKGLGGEVTYIVFSADGEWVASSARYSGIQIWDAKSGARKSTFGKVSDDVGSIAFSADCGKVAFTSDGPSVKIWDAVTETIRELTGHTETANSVAFSGDGKWLASASEDSTVIIWNAKTGAFHRAYRDHQKVFVKLVVFSPDSAWVASSAGYTRDTIKVWNPNTGTTQSTFGNENDAVEHIAFSADGQLVASVLEGGTVKIWDAATGSLRDTLQGHIGNLDYILHSISAPDDNKDVYGISEDRSWVLLNGKNWLWLPVDFRRCEFAIYGSTIAFGCLSGRVHIMKFD
ncbi:hypothetical protein NLG97_g6457 [Lecanicillium saksenae]|uniref:Uncharacterized protein n=1 Tax=Lecanicillium saksenae TaxID=468837 RepID=A0ACC1QR73_9HYPO|nr:hypothetical protein NLG97_g6457 [Lecanicillium saksenae]